VDLVDGLEGSAEAKKRLRAALESLGGTKSIEEVCEELGVKPSLIHQLRARALQAALGELEPKPVGRPRKKEKSAEEERIEALERQVESLRMDLALARAREELQAALPYLAERARVKKTKAEETK
jgi:transposase-like protein